MARIRAVSTGEGPSTTKSGRRCALGMLRKELGSVSARERESQFTMDSSLLETLA